MKREEIPYDKEFDYSKTNELDYSEVSKEKEKEITDYESDLNHYKIVEIPNILDGNISNWMIAKKSKTLSVPITPATTLDLYYTNWEFYGYNGGVIYDSLGSAIHNVKHIISKDNFEANKERILNNLNSQRVI